MDRPADAELERHYEAVKSRAGRAGLGLGGDEAAPRDVADHYNSLADRHRTLDSGSQILHVRNLHNWIKAVLIGRHMRPGHAVLDMACGKGGDMLKFKAGNCAHYVGVDIAAQSVCDAVARYNGSHGRGGMPFPAHFIAADICDGALETAFPPAVAFDLVSCQFALHYAFSSAERARAVMRNVACRLKPGGAFVGTLPDANVLVRRLREVTRPNSRDIRPCVPPILVLFWPFTRNHAQAAGLQFGNQHYHVQFSGKHAAKRFPAHAPFGVAYSFTLARPPQRKCRR